MSGLPPKAAAWRTFRIGRFVPVADKGIRDPRARGGPGPLVLSMVQTQEPE